MPTWSQEPLETQSATRATICLNGLWNFMPASGSAATFPNNDWGWLRVRGVLEEQAGQFDGAGWFRKSVVVPAAVAGKQLLLSLGPVDDFDTTFFNGQQIGAACHYRRTSCGVWPAMSANTAADTVC